ncbi:MAG: valine--tRNA ligase [Anaerolineae bacterium]|nr:valine--tRNA ligase [Anaerolineae bacterium]
MSLPKSYNPTEAEPRLQAFWQDQGIYHFNPRSDRPIYAVDTPPPTVSGHLHLGHVYSYSHPDFIVRFMRMNGYNIFYPMGYDDNGLPTERLVEKRLGITAQSVGRDAFIQRCLAVSEEAERDYQALWQRLGLSIDWRYTYRTIDDLSRKTSQLSFLDLYRQGRAYRQSAPAIYCPECRTTIAQAELADLERGSEFVTLAFRLPNGDALPIATTRPELLPACVAVFVHPDDARFQPLVGQQATVPLSGQRVPILADPDADPTKGTGAVMCCTFGDQADVTWWYRHHLPLIELIGRDGRLTDAAGEFAGLTTTEARQRIVAALEGRGEILGRQPVAQSIRVHERCDTPVEYIVVQQWFIRVLDEKETWLRAGDQVRWTPEHMRTRYREWVQGLNWDWCISRQRYFGVTFPVWYCADCGAIMLADEDQLPLDPTATQPRHPCACGGMRFTPETDVMDTWATSSLTPQIVARWLAEPSLYARLFPLTLRPQSHEIIRTWAFYTIVKSHYHFGAVPWRNVLISGWGIAGEGMGKISKSKGGGPMAPQSMIERYSADAVRYWTSSTGAGKDSVISEEKIQQGARLVNKLWNVARFAERFLMIEDQRPKTDDQRLKIEYASPSPIINPQSLIISHQSPVLSPADRWILARTQRLVRRVTDLFQDYDYAAAKSELEGYFWGDLADNYLEMAKHRLYAADHPLHAGAVATLHGVLLTITKLFAPLFPHITEEVYQGLFRATEGHASVHISPWPTVDEGLVDEAAERLGETLMAIATAVRRYKSERSLSVGAELARLDLAPDDAALADLLREAIPDLVSVTRARAIAVVSQLDAGLDTVEVGGLRLGIAR